MLSKTSRRLTYLNALLYAILGLPLFFPSQSLAPAFAWKVTPLMTMTFDFPNKPGQLIYVGAHFLIGIPNLFVPLRDGTGLHRS